MSEQRLFTCQMCGIAFSPTYRLSRHRDLRFCSKSCAAASTRAVFHRATDVEKAAVDAIKTAGRYVPNDELLGLLGISSKTLVAYNVSVAQCNREAGFKRPHRLFERLVGEALERHFVVETEVSFTGCVSPKGLPLRFDFLLRGTNVLVEADGTQHKDSRHPWASEYYLTCDSIKTDYAAKHGYTLVRIPYTKRVTYDYVLRHVTAACDTTEQSVTTNSRSKKSHEQAISSRAT